jgi:hypothetical protein
LLTVFIGVETLIGEPIGFLVILSLLGLNAGGVESAALLLGEDLFDIGQLQRGSAAGWSRDFLRGGLFCCGLYWFCGEQPGGFRSGLSLR